jgi:hypothetical protein
VLTDNAKTVTVEHIAGIPDRHPQMVAAGRHYGCQVVSCVPYDPESKGGAEATVRIAKADLVPTVANLLPAYGLLHRARRRLPDLVRHGELAPPPGDRTGPGGPTRYRTRHAARPARRTAGARAGRGTGGRLGLHYQLQLGALLDPARLHRREGVWCRVVGDELSITARTNSGDLPEIWRHQLSTPGVPQIIDAHYPDHPDGRSVHQSRLRPRSEAEVAFVGIGPGGGRWLKEAGPAGASRICEDGPRRRTGDGSGQ